MVAGKDVYMYDSAVLYKKLCHVYPVILVFYLFSVTKRPSLNQPALPTPYMLVTLSYKFREPPPLPPLRTHRMILYCRLIGVYCRLIRVIFYLGI